MNRTKKLSVVAVLAVAAVGCTQKDPTSVDASLLPEQPVTVEVTFPWQDFGSNLDVYGGYGTAAELGSGFVAKDYGGKVNAYTLVHFSTYPTQATLLDSLGGQITDYDLTFHGGRVVAFFDTLASTATKPITLDLSVIRQNWDVRTASWTMAVDSVGDQRPWTEPGAGPTESLVTAVWDPSAGDSAVFVLDSAQALTWQAPDTVSDTTVVLGARLSALTAGARLKVKDVALRLDTRSSLRPDTALVTSASRSDLTFIYNPPPAAPPDGVIRIGGVPAWRSVIDVDVPRTLDGPASLCAVVQCPLKLTSDQITYAALVLHSRESDPAYAPSDSVFLDIRPVFDRTALPKAPLGGTLITSGLGRRLAPSLFGADPGGRVEVPVTSWMQAVIADTTNTAPRTLAFLSGYEPIDISYASFYGPDSPMAPMLRLVVTVGPPVDHP